MKNKRQTIHNVITTAITNYLHNTLKIKWNNLRIYTRCYNDKIIIIVCARLTYKIVYDDLHNYIQLVLNMYKLDYTFYFINIDKLVISNNEVIQDNTYIKKLGLIIKQKNFTLRKSRLINSLLNDKIYIRYLNEMDNIKPPFNN